MLNLSTIVIYLIIGFLAGSRGEVTLLQFFLVWFNLILCLIDDYIRKFERRD
jgi:hypothetical protein